MPNRQPVKDIKKDTVSKIWEHPKLKIIIELVLSVVAKELIIIL